MHPIAEPIRGVLAICGRAVSLLARLFDLSRLRGELPQADGADDGRLQSRLAGALPRLRAGAAPYRVGSAIRTSRAALGVGIPLSVALMLLATQPAQAWEIGAVGITPINGTATRGRPFAFTITVTNNGNAVTSGTVTLADLVPTGLTATSISGTGWNCTLSPPRNTCTRSDALAVGASYPPISLFVSVDNDAPDLVFYQAFVSGGGYPNSAGTGVFEHVVSPPNLTITKAHNGNAIRGQIGFNYLISVSNSGAGPTDGTVVTVTDLLPPSLTATSMNGTDFNGDGNWDILWYHNPTGTVGIWLMNGMQVLQTGTVGVLASGWSIAGTGDFNGDGKSDILWHHMPTGTVAVWLMNSMQVLQSGAYGSVAAIGDGKSDILWRDTSVGGGAVAIWLINGLQVSDFGGLGTVGLNWQIQGTNAD